MLLAIFLLVTVFSQSLLTLMRRNFMSFSFLSTRHNDLLIFL